MITTLPGASETKPASAGTPLPGVDAAVVDENGNEVPHGTQGLLVLRRPWPGMLRSLYKEEDRFSETYYGRFGDTTYLVGDAARKDTGRLPVDPGSGGRRDQRLRASHLHRGDRVGLRFAPQGRRDGGDRPDPTRPPDRRSAPSSRSRATWRAPMSWPRRSATTLRPGSRRSPGRSGSSGPATCRKPARGRSCADCCETSQRAASSAT